jgi:hypothetical protein
LFRRLLLGGEIFAIGRVANLIDNRTLLMYALAQYSR